MNCPVCGNPVNPPRRKYCSEICRERRNNSQPKAIIRRQKYNNKNREAYLNYQRKYYHDHKGTK